VALLIPFLNSTLLFSSISPDFKKYLWDELWNCEKFVGLDYKTLKHMPTYLRKIHIHKHNEYISEQNEKARQRSLKNKNKK